MSHSVWTLEDSEPGQKKEEIYISLLFGMLGII